MKTFSSLALLSLSAKAAYYTQTLADCQAFV